ncbi:hypothetical protein Tco_1492192 [Tanacetum coccineum]
MLYHNHIEAVVTPKISHLNAVKRIFKYLKGKPNLGLWYPRESPLDLEAFSNSDYGGSNLDRKSTTDGCQFLGQRLISWQCKKQTIVATSTTEAEYVAAANCCGQVLWVQNQLLDYGFNFMNTKIHIDNESTICIVKNPVYHSKTKHIEIRHHFIRDCYEKKLISVEKIHTDLNVADLLTKPFDGPRFNYLVVLLGVEKEWTGKSNLGMENGKCQVSLAIGLQFGFWVSYSKPTESAGFYRRCGFPQKDSKIESLLGGKLQIMQMLQGIHMLQNVEIFAGLQKIMGMLNDRIFTFRRKVTDNPMEILNPSTFFPVYMLQKWRSTSTKGPVLLNTISPGDQLPHSYHVQINTTTPTGTHSVQTPPHHQGKGSEEKRKGAMTERGPSAEVQDSKTSKELQELAENLEEGS